MGESSPIRSGLRKGNRVRSSRGSGLVRSDTLAEKLIEHFRARLRTLAERDGCPRSDHARFLLPLAEMQSVTAPLAAEKASLALTCDFGAVCKPPVGSKTRTTASQNVIRRKNHIARPCFQRHSNPHPWAQKASIVKTWSQISEVFGRRGNHGLGINQRNPYVGIGLRLALDESVAGF